MSDDLYDTERKLRNMVRPLDGLERKEDVGLIMEFTRRLERRD